MFRLPDESRFTPQEQELHAGFLTDAKSAAKTGTWRLDLSSSQVFLSESACELFGFLPDSPVHTLESLLSLVHPEDVAKVHYWLGVCRAQQTPGVLDFRLLPVAESFRIVRAECALIDDAQNRPVQMAGTVVDVTEHSRSKARAEVGEQFLQTASQGVLIAGADHFIISANRVFSEMTGYAAAEILGRNCRFLQGPFTDAKTVEAIRTCLRECREFSGEILNYRKDGSPFWNALTITPVRDSSGYWTHFVGVSRDVSLHKEAELALRTSETQMEILFESSIAGAALATLDGYFLKVNPALCSLLGFSEAELLDLSFDELTHPEDVAKIRGALESILQGRAESFELEKRCIHKSGLPVWCFLKLGLIRDAQGTPMHLIGHIRDIGDRKRDEQRIFEAESRFRAAFENASVGISVTNTAGHALMVNEAYARNLGYSPEELISTDLTRLVLYEDLEVFYGLGAQLFYGELPTFECESRHIHRDGRIVWIKTQVSLTRDPQGLPLNFIVLAEDVTEKRLAKVERENLLASERAARNEAERANQLKNEFLTTLSHELRTPLNAIMGWVELLKDSEDDPETLAEGLAVIRRNVRTQSKLIDDLLELSRIESGHMHFEQRPVDVARVIAAAVEVVGPAAAAKSISIATEWSDEAIFVRGDAVRLQQVVWNFLSNAVKFTPEGGRVLVILQRVGGSAEISVADEGAGIRADFLPHVFDRFRQQDSATTRRHGGLGIGLTLAKELIELHGGTVAAASLGEGQGSTFTATLPLISEEDGGGESNALARPSRPAALSLEGVRILIVDDQEDTRVLVTHTLEAEGGRVYSASNAVDGLSLVRNEKPHVILSDIGMPVHDGYTFIKWVRSLSPTEGGRTPAAAFTAFARPQDKAIALANGFQLHVVKPVSRKQLVAAVVQLLSRAETPS